MSSSNWINRPIGLIDTNQNSKVIMNWNQANTLYNAVVNPPFASVVASGDFSKWVSRFMWVPFEFKNVGLVDYQTNLAGVVYKDVLNSGFIQAEDENGYFLGEKKIDKFSSFMDYEPYSKYKVWLPYYGYADLKASDISNKYIEFLLFMDLNTGQAQYVLGVSDKHIEITNAPYLIYNQDKFKDCRIIGSYSLNIGYEIPLGSVGMADAIRNMSLSTIKLGGNLAHGISRSNNVKTTEKALSNVSNETVKDSTLHSFFNDSLSVLDTFQLNPQLDKVNNGILNTATPRSIIFIKYTTCTTQDITNINFRKLYGLPLNEIKSLNKVYGYTEINDLHLEDKAFGNATSEEKTLLKNLLSGGVIFPDKIFNINVHLVNCTGNENNKTTIEYKEGIVSLTFKSNTGYSFGSAPLVSLNGCEILNQTVDTDNYTLTIYNATDEINIEIIAIENTN